MSDDPSDGRAGTQEDNTPQSTHIKSSLGGISELFQRPAVQEQLKSVVAYFAVVGVGLGVTGYLILSQLMKSVMGGSDSGSLASMMGSVVAVMVVFIALFTVIMVGPVVAAVVTSKVHGALDLERTDLYAVEFAGSYLGAVVMVIIAAVLISLGIPGGESTTSSSGSASLDIGQSIVPLMITGIPSGLVGAGVGYVEDNFTLGRVSESRLDDSTVASDD